LSVFEAYADHAEHAYERGFRGCGLLNAAAEFPAGDAGRKAVRAHKEEVQALLNKHLAELMPGDAERAAQLARHLAFLFEGAIVRAGLEGNSDCVIQAKHMAASMLEAAMGDGGLLQAAIATRAIARHAAVLRLQWR